MKFKTKNELIIKMESLVNNFMKSYQTDFIEYDKKRLMNSKADKYVWILRTTGTQLLIKNDLKDAKTYSSSCYDYYADGKIYNQKEVKYYEVDLYDNSISLIKDTKKYLREIRC